MKPVDNSNSEGPPPPLSPETDATLDYTPSPFLERAISAPHSTPDVIATPKRVSQERQSALKGVTRKIDFTKLDLTPTENPPIHFNQSSLGFQSQFFKRNLKLKILIVDDVVVNQKILEKFSSIGLIKASFDYVVHRAINGVEACKQHQAAYDAGEPYGLIFMDNDMPLMNGLEAITHIRKIEQDSLIVVQSAAATDVIQACLAAAGQRSLMIKKPVDQKQVLQVVLKELKRISGEKLLDFDLVAKKLSELMDETYTRKPQP